MLESGCEDLALSVPMVARLFGINDEFTYELVNRGLLLSDKEKPLTIRQYHLIDFQKRFVILSKLAKVVGVSSRTLIFYVKAREVYAIDSNMGKLRQRLYWRRELIVLPFVRDFLLDGLDWDHSRL